MTMGNSPQPPAFPASESSGANGRIIITRQPLPNPGMNFVSLVRNEQQAWRGRGGCCPGGGLCGVGANKDHDDERLEMEQRARQEARAQASLSPIGAHPVSVLQPPPPAVIHDPRPVKASKTSRRTPSLPGERPQAGGSQQKATQSRPGPRAPAKTLPPNVLRPDIQTPRQSGSGRTQSMGGRRR